MAIISITRAEVDGDAVTVTGTVDGQELSVQVWKSHLDKLGNKAARVGYVALQLKAAAETGTPKGMIDLQATVTL